MRSIMGIGLWLYRRAENLLALMLAAMFLAFLLQVLFRYALNLPIGWTNELSSILWIWIVLFGAAFVLREEEEIRFDLLYSSVRPGIRHLMFLISAAALIFLYVVSFPAVVDYVTFMKVEKTSYLQLRFDWVFSIYIIFVLAVLVRYCWLSWRVLAGRDPGRSNAANAVSDL
jgi:TRAP-type C4-dicarboxylate transport system permease small subunit